MELNMYGVSKINYTTKMIKTMTWSLKTLTIGFVYVNTNAQWVVAY